MGDYAINSIVLLASIALIVGVVVWYRRRESRRRASVPVAAQPLAQAATRSSPLCEPRAHHYAFAHRFLASVALDDPRQSYRYFCSPAGAAPLRQMWDFVGSHMESAADVLPAGGLRLSWHALDGQRKLAVVCLPEPRAMTEAYFVGIVFERHGEQDWRCASYYTLELSFDFAEQRATAMLCGWTKESHLNFGQRVLPDEEAFVRAIKELSGPACVN